jgi:rfaE bifunctional protein nucleotidyltransferase chain/domain
MPSRYPEYDVSRLRTYSVEERPSKVALNQLARPFSPSDPFSEFLDSLPDTLAARDLREVARRVAEARHQDRAVVWAMGAHVIKVGLAPVLIDLMEREILTAIAVNGAVAVHDSEIALWGQTSEEVESALADGSFGMAKETHAFVNGCAKAAQKEGLGYGEALGRALQDAPHSDRSLFAQAYRLGVPMTVHVALGTDIVHMHPTADGAAIGEATMRDFRILTAAMQDLSDGGVLFNVGSAVLLPEILLKAMAILSNGNALHNFTGVNMDFVQLYRPLTQVVRRVKALGGEGFALTGHHEIMVPLLAASVRSECGVRSAESDEGKRGRGEEEDHFSPSHSLTPSPPHKATPHSAQKILRRMQLRRELDARRARGERIVFTNGVFDLMHMGHVRYLQQARGLGDCLIVGVNADETVRRLKGPKRPLLPEIERARLLAALAAVDYVTIFEEDTPEALIRALQPDVHVKGGDYKPDELPEADAVKEYGGEVRILPFLPGRSTTKLIEEIVKRYGSDRG